MYQSGGIFSSNAILVIKINIQSFIWRGFSYLLDYVTPTESLEFFFFFKFQFFGLAGNVIQQIKKSRPSQQLSLSAEITY